MIVAWPGLTQAGSVCRQPVIIEDFFPTILEMAGIQHAEQLGGVIDGCSFVNLLRGEQDEARQDRPLVWHFPNNWGPRGPGIGPSSAIRLGDWKLIYYHESQHFELFNLAEDLGEQKNLAEKRTDVRDRLAAELGEYLASVKAQMPIVKASGQTVPYPGSAVPAGKDR
jgi:arylsulfatase A-like enzyme